MTGEIVMRPCLYWLYGGSEGLIAVQAKQGGLWGDIDYEGNWVIPPMFRRAFRFTEGLASVTDADGKSGF